MYDPPQTYDDAVRYTAILDPQLNILNKVGTGRMTSMDPYAALAL